MAKYIDPKIKKDWLKALRSGKYPQIDGKLVAVGDHNKHLGYCCLGVLSCKVLKDSKELEYYNSDNSWDDDLRELKYVNTKAGILPRRVARAVALDCVAPFEAYLFAERLDNSWDEDFHRTQYNSMRKRRDKGVRHDSILMQMNDRGASFEKIAEYIEKFILTEEEAKAA